MIYLRWHTQTPYSEKKTLKRSIHSLHFVASIRFRNNRANISISTFSYFYHSLVLCLFQINTLPSQAQYKHMYEFVERMICVHGSIKITKWIRLHSFYPVACHNSATNLFFLFIHTTHHPLSLSLSHSSANANKYSQHFSFCFFFSARTIRLGPIADVAAFIRL